MIYKFCDWVNVDMLNWYILSKHLDKYNLIEKYLHKMDLYNMCFNEYAVAYIADYKKLRGYLTFSPERSVGELRNSPEASTEPENEFCGNEVEAKCNVEKFKCDVNWRNLSSNEGAVWHLEKNIDHIYWNILSSNKNAINLLKKYPEKINWFIFSSNESPDIIPFLEENIDNVCWDELCYNEHSIPFLYENQDKLTELCFYTLSACDYAVPLLKQNISKLKRTISLNESDWAISFLEENEELIDWGYISSNENPKVLNILKKNIFKVYWRALSGNPVAIELLEQYPEKINWSTISRNPNAIHLLKQNIDKIDWNQIIYNNNQEVIDILKPNLDKVNFNNLSYASKILFEYDYVKMKTNMDIIREELIKKALHPLRVCSWIEQGFDEF